MGAKMIGVVALLASVVGFAAPAFAHERERARSDGYGRWETQRRERERQHEFRRDRDWRERATVLPYAPTTYVPAPPPAASYVSARVSCGGGR